MRMDGQRSDPGFAVEDGLGRSLFPRRSALRFGKSIPAERRRVYCALTLPEYMESWLSIPGAAPGCVTVETDNQSFSIYCLDVESARLSIRCSYRTCNNKRLLFDWKCDSLRTARTCLVQIRLVGEFERTNLELIHLGLDPSKINWHHELWDKSLARLSSLFQFGLF